MSFFHDIFLHILIQLIDQFFCIHKENLISGFTCIPANPGGDHTFTDSRRPNDYDIFMVIHKFKSAQRLNFIRIQVWIEAVINVRQPFIRVEISCICQAFMPVGVSFLFPPLVTA